MKVLKFGGTSVGSAKRMWEVGQIVKKATAKEKAGVVVSAVTGVTNQLIKSVSEVLAGKKVSNHIQDFRRIHFNVLQELNALASPQLLAHAEEEIRIITREYENLLTGVQLLRECPESIMDNISSMGERASAPIIEAIFKSLEISTRLIDPRDYLITDSVFGNASPIMKKKKKRFAGLRDESAKVILMPGFYGADLAGKITTLGRGGSDFSAAIMAAAINADVLEIWTDVDGVYSADPRMVPDAFVLDEMSYAEAMEMAFFGAKVLHPRTIAPVVLKRIPTWIKNTFNPDYPGTLIQSDVKESRLAARGLSSLGNVSMIGISGAGLRGVPGVAARVFSAMARESISVILITQSSSEYSICFCIPDNQKVKAVAALESEFSLERAASLVNPIEELNDLSIISVVGDQMKSRRGIAGTFFAGLATADVNVVAIAQGFSERNISAVIKSADASRAMRIAHQFFFNTRQGIQVFLIGPGSVGSSLLEQIRRQQAGLLKQEVDLKVCGILNSRNLLFNIDGIDLTTWKEKLASGEPLQMKDFIRQVQNARLLNPILVDCTSSQEVTDAYPSFFEAGMHVVTANKKANSGSLSYYSALRQTANRRQRKYLYQTNVGAGLPIINSLQNMIKSGDHLLSCSGILSGSLSFLFGLVGDGVHFSEALLKARMKGFTEPDPRDDLSGLDVARKLLILAREAGFKIELSDITIESPLPSWFDSTGTPDSFIAKSVQLDRYFSERSRDLKAKGKVLRFVGRLDGNKAKVGLCELSQEDPLYHVREGENAVSFLTERYQPIPLVVRGYGAGPEVTAGGVFADILRTVFWNTEDRDTQET